MCECLSLFLDFSLLHKTFCFIPLYQSTDLLPLKTFDVFFALRKKKRNHQTNFQWSQRGFSCCNPFAGFAYDTIFIESYCLLIKWTMHRCLMMHYTKAIILAFIAATNITYGSYAHP